MAGRARAADAGGVAEAVAPFCDALMLALAFTAELREDPIAAGKCVGTDSPVRP
jgi:hypothetical protein